MANEQQNLTVQSIAAVTHSNLELLKPEWLSDDRIVEKIKLYVLDVSDSSDPAEAGRVLQILHKLIAQLPNLSAHRPDIFEEYLRILSVLKVCIFPAMTRADEVNFMKQDLVTALEVLDFDVQTKINETFLIYYKYEEGQQEIAKDLVRAMETSEEYLGTESLKIKGREHDEYPTVANWIIDYNQYSVSLAGNAAAPVKRGGIERASYITHSPNVKVLRDDEKTILKRVLELYDWLKAFLPAPQMPTNALYYKAERITVPVPRSATSVPLPPKPPGLSPRELKKENIEYGISNIGEPKPKAPVPPHSTSLPTRDYARGTLPSSGESNKEMTKPRVLPPPPRPRQGPQAAPLPDPRPNDQGLVGQAPHPDFAKATTGRQGEGMNAKTGADKDVLYKSTLEELHKMREEGQSFSVNAAVARASSAGEGGEVVAGDVEVDKKLHELERKLEEED